MGIRKQLSQYAGRRITRRLYRTMPWIGGVLAILTLGKAVRRKGVIGGTVDTALDFIPFVGGAKNLAEMGRGRDLIPDKPTRRS
jgi:putative toxin of predicted polymorphic toxin system